MTFTIIFSRCHDTCHKASQNRNDQLVPLLLQPAAYNHGWLLNQPWQETLCSESLGSWLGNLGYTMMISHSSLFHWRWIFAEHSSVTHPQVSIMGPKWIINRAVLTAIQDIYQEDSDLYLDELCTPLAAEHQIFVTTLTLSQNLIEARLTRKVLHKLAIEWDEILQEDWRNGLCNDFSDIGSEFICVDETSKNNITYTHSSADLWKPCEFYGSYGSMKCLWIWHFPVGKKSSLLMYELIFTWIVKYLWYWSGYCDTNIYCLQCILGNKLHFCLAIHFQIDRERMGILGIVYLLHHINIKQWIVGALCYFGQIDEK